MNLELGELFTPIGLGISLYDPMPNGLVALEGLSDWVNIFSVLK
jgi:hypothetical protein